MAAAATGPKLLALCAGTGHSVVGGPIYWRVPSCVGAGSNRPVHAAQSSDLGVFDEREEYQPDTLNRFEHWWATPVQVVLLLFGFANAGVPFTQIGAGAYYVLAGLLIGKPIGIVTFSGMARLAGGHLPPGLRQSDLFVVGIVAAVGFTVSLFFATAAFPAGAALAETKMGALLSFVAAPIAVALSRMLRVRARWRPENGQTRPHEQERLAPPEPRKGTHRLQSEPLNKRFFAKGHIQGAFGEPATINQRCLGGAASRPPAVAG